MSFRAIPAVGGELEAYLRQLGDDVDRLQNGGANRGLISFDETIRVGDILFTTAGDGTIVFTDAATGADAFPPGRLIAHDPVGSDVPVTATTEATANVIARGSEQTYDGGPVFAEFFAPSWNNGNVLAQLVVLLLEDGVVQGQIFYRNAGAGALDLGSIVGNARVQPAAGRHTLSVAAYVNTPSTIRAGAGGPATYVPAYLRVTRDT